MVQFPTISGGDAGRWCPDGKGLGHHIASGSVQLTKLEYAKLKLADARRKFWWYGICADAELDAARAHYKKVSESPDRDSPVEATTSAPAKPGKAQNQNQKQGSKPKDGKKDASKAKPAKEAAKPKPKPANNAPPPADGSATVEMFEKTLFKVAHVISAAPVENSDKLYLCQLEVGEDKPRQVVTGLQKHVAVNELEGHKVMLILNLKTARLAGINSEAMIMCSDDPKTGVVKLVVPPQSAAIGEQVFLEGGEASTSTVKQLKSAVWDPVKAALFVKGGAATFNGTPLRVASGPVMAAAGVDEGAPIK